MKLVHTVFIVLSLVCPSFNQQQPARACGVQIVIDPFLWEQVLSETNAGSSEEKERIARYEAVSLAGRLVNQATSVLSRQLIGGLKYTLILQDVQILTRENCGDLCETDLSIESLLSIFAYEPRDPYCLSYLLTFRSFDAGKLGLAFTASSYHGGVCETFRIQKENIGGYEGDVNKSLNTGVVTFNRSGRKVSEVIAGITFAHEIGHSFGASHDPPECSGDTALGTFIMHKSGSLGDRKNNMLLSACSLSGMANVLSSLELRETGSCWRLDTGRGTCGNSVVEVWEECDCGVDPAECEKQCCVPPGDPLGRQPCKLTQGAQCSPSEGLCCNSSCLYSPSTDVCAEATECSEDAFCTGKTSYCPFASSVAESTSCAGGSLLCKKGKCEGSVCPTFGMLSCVSEAAEVCFPHCYSPTTPCSAVNISYPVGRECRIGDVYGYCGAEGQCSLGSDTPQQSWIVGVAIFIIFYVIFMVVALWIYCRYCRPNTVTLLPVKGRSEHSELSDAQMLEN